jgi:hypothetical protein
MAPSIGGWFLIGVVGSASSISTWFVIGVLRSVSLILLIDGTCREVIRRSARQGTA